MNKDKVEDELAVIAEENDGILRAEDVVEFARNPETALHSRFEWEDTVAGHQWRLQQARQIIRVVVNKIEITSQPISAYVSLVSDRSQPGGGYRTLVSVMDDKDKRAELMAQARKELAIWRRRYDGFREFAAIYAAIDNTAHPLLLVEHEGVEVRAA